MMRKLKNRILGILLLFTLLPLSIFGGFSIYQTNRKIDDMTERNLATVSENQRINIKNFCEDRKSEMEMVANYAMTQAAIKESVGEPNPYDAGKVDLEYINNVLKERKKYGMFVASISILDKDFRVVASSESYEIREISKMKYSNERFHTGGFIMGDVYERNIDDESKRLIPAYVGVYDEERLLGYIAEELDTAYFDELRLNMDSLAAGTFYLLDGNGMIITAGDTKQKKSLSHFVTDSSERNSFQKAWDEVDHNSNPVGKIYYKYRGDSYVTYYSDVDNTNWGMRLTDNLSAQRQTGRSYTVMLCLAFAFFVLAIFIVQIFITKNVLAPIEQIMNVFNDIKATQDYSKRLPKSNSVEMNQLSDEINGLLTHIEDENIQEKERQRHLRELAECDPLTGINNKKAIEQKMLAMVQSATDKKVRISVGFLDIDDFKDYNTNYGHQEGDNVIKFVANTLKDNFKGEVGRNGGDEFVFGYEGDISKEELDRKVKKVYDILNKGYTRGDLLKNMSVPCSIGIVTAIGGSFDYAKLLKEADNAMYDAKINGKNTYVIREL